MTIPEELEGVLDVNPKIISGAVRFKCTRVPVQALIDTLTHGLPVSDFLEGFPDVTEEQAMAVRSQMGAKPGAPDIRPRDGWLSAYPDRQQH